VIVSVDGEPVGDVGELQSLLTERFIGRPVAIGFVRDGRLTTSQVSCVELH
jgi:S1-C subfamily serine protease